MKVKLIHDCDIGKDGDELDLPVGRAKLLVWRGFAQLLPSDQAQVVPESKTNSSPQTKPSTTKA